MNCAQGTAIRNILRRFPSETRKTGVGTAVGFAAVGMLVHCLSSPYGHFRVEFLLDFFRPVAGLFENKDFSPLIANILNQLDEESLEHR